MSGVFLPASYQMTFTASAVKAGNYTLVGSDDSYTVVSAGSTVTIGPFSTGKQFEVKDLSYSQAPLAYYTDGAINSDETDASNYSFVDNDVTMAADADELIPTQKAVKAYVDSGVQDAKDYADGLTAADLTALGENNVAEIANDADGTAIAAAVNGILAILVAAGLMDAPA